MIDHILTLINVQKESQIELQLQYLEGWMWKDSNCFFIQ